MNGRALQLHGTQPCLSR